MLSGKTKNLITKQRYKNPIISTGRKPKTFSKKQFRVSLPDSYSLMLSEILKVSGQSMDAFCRGCIMREIDTKALELLGIIPGSQEADYHKIYGHWVIGRMLKANWTHHKPNLQLIQDALSLYNEDTIKQAMDAYAEIIHNPDMYLWDEPCIRMEDWITKHIKVFLPDADPHALERYAAPGVRELQAFMGN